MQIFRVPHGYDPHSHEIMLCRPARRLVRITRSEELAFLFAPQACGRRAFRGSLRCNATRKQSIRPCCWPLRSSRPAPAWAAAPIRWKFKEGQSLNYVLERGAEGKVNLTGAEFAFKMGMTFDTTWQVKSVAADGTATVEQTVDRIQINMSSPLAGNMAYDSKNTEKPAAGPVWAMLEPVVTGMLGQTFKVKISSLGAVSDIELPAKLSESFAKQQGRPESPGRLGNRRQCLHRKGHQGIDHAFRGAAARDERREGRPGRRASKT